MRKKTIALLKERGYPSMRNSQIQPATKLKTSTSTPYLYLPKIGGHSGQLPISGTEGVDRLESYIHELIAEKHQETLILKRQKKIREDFESKKENVAKNEEEEKKKLQRKRIRELEERLKGLKGELGVEEKKLEVECNINERMMLQYNQVYDSLHNRVRGAVRQDSSAQTDSNTITVQTEELKQVQSAVAIKIPGQYKRKFRVAAFAVYFSLAFPKYVKVFRQLRKKYFFQKIVQNQQLSTPIQNYFKLLSSFKLAELQRERQRISRRSSQIAPSFSFQEIDEDGNQKIKSIPLESIAGIVVHLLREIKQNLMEGNLDELLKVLSFYFTNKSFLSDDVFLIDELYRLKIDQNSRQIKLQKAQQRRLILNFLISKLTCFNFMIAGNKQNQKIIKRNSKITKQHLNKSLTRSLLLGGLFLFKKCNQTHSDQIVEEKWKRQGNVETLAREVFPVPMGELEVSQKFDLSGSKGIVKRISIEQMIHFASLNVEGIKYKNMQKTLQILNNFSIANEHTKDIQTLLKEIGKLAHEKCWRSRVEHFQIIEQNAILHQHLLTEQIEDQNYIQKRLPNEASLIESSILLIKRARNEVPKQQKSMKSFKSTDKQIEISKKSLPLFKSNPNTSRNTEALVSEPLTRYEELSNEKIIFDESSTHTLAAKLMSNKQNLKSSLHARHRGTQSGEIKVKQSEKPQSSDGIIAPTIKLSGIQRQILRNRLKDIDEEMKRQR